MDPWVGIGSEVLGRTRDSFVRKESGWEVVRLGRGSLRRLSSNTRTVFGTLQGSDTRDEDSDRNDRERQETGVTRGEDRCTGARFHDPRDQMTGEGSPGPRKDPEENHEGGGDESVQEGGLTPSVLGGRSPRVSGSWEESSQVGIPPILVPVWVKIGVVGETSFTTPTAVRVWYRSTPRPKVADCPRRPTVRLGWGWSTRGSTRRENSPLRHEKTTVFHRREDL